VVLFAYAKGDRVFTESYFSNGKRCRDSRIEVFDGLGNKLLEGKTDNNGAFSFKPPKKTDLRIVLTASMGHRDEYTIPAGDLSGETEGETWKAEYDQAGKKVFRGEKVIAKALEEELKPITRLLVKRQSEGISFVRVVGGIGFIFGIMGVILYFRNRRGR
jgi:nickel transport protein